MKKQTLTAKRVARLLRRPGRYRDDGPARGLLLVVTNANNASWQLRYQIGNKERWLGLGSVKEFSLKEARERARAARQKLADGIDPLEARRAEESAKALAAAKSLSFEGAAVAYFDQHEKGWSNAKHRNQFLSSLRAFAFPVIGKLPVAAIDTGLVLKVLEPHWHKTPETASRVRGRIERILDWAAVRGYRSGENPARWRGHLAEVLPARAKLARTVHHPALAYAEVPSFISELRGHKAVAALALEFAILTAARTGEVVFARWDEIDFAKKTWTVPASRMKSKKEHRVPLSERAIEILEALPRERQNPFVFIGAEKASSLSDSAMLALLRRMGRSVTTHGFRSSFRDWASERTNYQNHIVEMALAHVIGSAVERAYRRGELIAKRTRLMADWATYCTRPAAPAPSKILPLRARRA